MWYKNVVTAISHTYTIDNIGVSGLSLYCEISRLLDGKFWTGSGWGSQTSLSMIDRSDTTNPGAFYFLFTPDNTDTYFVRIYDTGKTTLDFSYTEECIISNNISVTDVESALTAQGYTTARAGYMDVLNGLVAAIWASVTRTLTDKTGFSLTSGEHTNIASDTQTGLTAQGYTTSRAAKLDELDSIYNILKASGPGDLAAMLVILQKFGFDAGNLVKVTVRDVDGTAVTGLENIIIGTDDKILVSSDQQNLSSTFHCDGGASPSAIWNTLLPGLFNSGTAGYLIGNYVNSRLSDIKTSADAAARPGAAMALTSGQLTSIINSIWEEPTASHVNTGTMGKAMGSAGSAGDPWSISLPGSYTAGTAGFIVGTNINSSLSGISTAVGNIWTSGTRTLTDFSVMFNTQFMLNAFAGDTETFVSFLQNLNLGQVRPRNAVIAEDSTMWEYYYPLGASPTHDGSTGLRKRQIKNYDGSMPTITATDIAQLFPIQAV